MVKLLEEYVAVVKFHNAYHVRLIYGIVSNAKVDLQSVKDHAVHVHLIVFIVILLDLGNVIKINVNLAIQIS